MKKLIAMTIVLALSASAFAVTVVPTADTWLDMTGTIVNTGSPDKVRNQASLTRVVLSQYNIPAGVWTGATLKPMYSSMKSASSVAQDSPIKIGVLSTNPNLAVTNPAALNATGDTAGVGVNNCVAFGPNITPIGTTIWPGTVGTYQLPTLSYTGLLAAVNAAAGGQLTLLLGVDMASGVTIADLLTIENIGGYSGGGIPYQAINLELVPEPATMSLLALGGMVALLRRKR